MYLQYMYLLFNFKNLFHIKISPIKMDYFFYTKFKVNVTVSSLREISPRLLPIVLPQLCAVEARLACAVEMKPGMCLLILCIKLLLAWLGAAKIIVIFEKIVPNVAMPNSNIYRQKYLFTQKK